MPAQADGGDIEIAAVLAAGLAVDNQNGLLRPTPAHHPSAGEGEPVGEGKGPGSNPHDARRARRAGHATNLRTVNGTLDRGSGDRPRSTWSDTVTGRRIAVRPLRGRDVALHARQ